MRSAAWLVAAALTAALAAPAAAQTGAEAADLAQLLQLEDTRQFDLTTLRSETQNPDSLIRAQAALAIGRIGDRAGTPLLLPLLSDADTTVRTDAAFALGLLRDTAAVAELASRVTGFPAVAGDPDQVAIVQALAMIGGPAAAQTLDGLLQRHPPSGDESDPATAAALLEAWRLGRAAPAARLAEYVRSAAGLWRRNATFSVARLHLAGAADALLQAATDPDAVTRAWAARALTAALADSAHLARGAFEARLNALVADADPGVRIAALAALATFRDSAQAGAALSRLSDAYPNVVIQALTTLGALGGARAVAALEDQVAHGATFALRRAALLGLAEAAPAGGAAAAAGWVHDPDWRLRAVAGQALGVAATDTALATLRAMVADADPRVAETALEALGAATPEPNAALAALAIRALAAADPYVRVAALDVLDRQRDPELVPVLVRAYRRAAGDQVSDARLAAVAALGDIAAQGGAARTRVLSEFLAAVPRSPDYLVRRYAAELFGRAAVSLYWGDVLPVATGRSATYYRDVATRLWLPALQGGRLPQVTIETGKGDLQVILYAGDAPLTVRNFLDLVARHYFDGGRWHRVVPGFVVQDGDPRGDGNGGPGWTIRDELNPRPYYRGTVGMALSGPDTGGSQFFIALAQEPHLDGGYTVFGQVIQGDATLDQIVRGDQIRRIVQQ